MLARLRVSVGRSPSSSERVEKSNLDLITQPSTTAVQGSLNHKKSFRKQPFQESSDRLIKMFY